MSHKSWRDRVPSLLLGAGIVAATCTASLAEASGWLVLLGPLVLAITFVLAAKLAAGRTGRSPDVFAATLSIAMSFALAGLILFLRGGHRVVEFIPIMGVAGWVSFLQRSGNRRTSCAGN